MKRFLIVIACSLLMLALLGGCGTKEEATPDTSAAGHPEEVADSTRMDSAMLDTTVIDSALVDSVVKEGVDEAVEQATEGGH